MINFTNGDSCPICSSKNIENFLSFKNAHQFIDSYKSFTMEKDICGDCGHIFASSCHDYDIEGHYETARGRGDLIYAKASQIVQDEYNDLVNWFSEASSSPKKILDMGCGKCELLNSFNNYYPSSDVFGVDYSEDSIEYGKAFDIKNIVAGDLYKDFPNINGFDVICATNVLEHQYDLNKFLNRMKELANKNARFLIQVPDSYSIIYRKDLGSKYMHDLYNDEHTHHFNIENLSNILRVNGFEVIKYRTNQRNDWDLIDIVFKLKNDNYEHPLVFQNKEVTEKLITDFTIKRDKDINILNKALQNKCAIGIYGGGWHTDVCLPSYYDFDFQNVEAILDMDSRKQGNELLGVKVIEPTRQALSKLDVVLISSINLNDDIYKFLLDMGVEKNKILNLY